VPFAKIDGKAPVGHYPHPDSTYLCQVKKRIVKGEALLDHLEAGILRIYEDRGPHGLPLSKFSDWNDCLNLLGKNHKAESVLVASMLIKASKDLVELLTFLKSPHYLPSQKLRQASASRINHYNKIISTMTKVLNKAGWDGAWFKRSFDDSQKPVGSKSSKEGKIYLEPQPWAVMSGGADPQKALSCMDSVYKLLFTSYGIKLLHPAYTRYYKELGEISTYPPGLKENASIFCHPNPWATIAECMLGRGDRAFEFYKATLPISQNEKADIRKVEPYVFCQMVASNDHPDFGEGKNSWLTGSAAWNFYAASQYLLGIRPDYEGLRIDPCIPKKWEEFSVYRKFRGTSYNIVVKNPKKVSRGVKSILVDGKKIVGNLIPIFNDRKEHKVEVYL
jgi:cellobiose phosphorylase